MKLHSLHEGFPFPENDARWCTERGVGGGGVRERFDTCCCWWCTSDKTGEGTYMFVAAWHAGRERRRRENSLSSSCTSTSSVPAPLFTMANRCSALSGFEHPGFDAQKARAVLALAQGLSNPSLLRTHPAVKGRVPAWLKASPDVSLLIRSSNDAAAQQACMAVMCLARSLPGFIVNAGEVVEALAETAAHKKTHPLAALAAGEALQAIFKSELGRSGSALWSDKGETIVSLMLRACRENHNCPQLAGAAAMALKRRRIQSQLPEEAITEEWCDVVLRRCASADVDAGNLQLATAVCGMYRGVDILCAGEERRIRIVQLIRQSMAGSERTRYAGLLFLTAVAGGLGGEDSDLSDSDEYVGAPAVVANAVREVISSSHGQELCNTLRCVISVLEARPKVPFGTKRSLTRWETAFDSNDTLDDVLRCCLLSDSRVLSWKAVKLLLQACVCQKRRNEAALKVVQTAEPLLSQVFRTRYSRLSNKHDIMKEIIECQESSEAEPQEVVAVLECLLEVAAINADSGFMPLNLLIQELAAHDDILEAFMTGVGSISRLKPQQWKYSASILDLHLITLLATDRQQTGLRLLDKGAHQIVGELLVHVFANLEDLRSEDDYEDDRWDDKSELCGGHVAIIEIATKAIVWLGRSGQCLDIFEAETPDGVLYVLRQLAEWEEIDSQTRLWALSALSLFGEYGILTKLGRQVEGNGCTLDCLSDISFCVSDSIELQSHRCLLEQSCPALIPHQSDVQVVKMSSNVDARALKLFLNFLSTGRTVARNSEEIRMNLCGLARKCKRPDLVALIRGNIPNCHEEWNFPSYTVVRNDGGGARNVVTLVSNAGESVEFDTYILAVWSPYFQRMFLTNAFADSSGEKINIECSTITLQTFRNYMYEKPLWPKNIRAGEKLRIASELYILADSRLVDGLADVAEQAAASAIAALGKESSLEIARNLPPSTFSLSITEHFSHL